MHYRFELPPVDEMFYQFFTPSHPRARTYAAPVDVAENADETVVLVELPGVKKEDVRLTVGEGVLTIEAERKDAELPQGAKQLLRETPRKNFAKSLTIGHEVDSEKISAELRDGILKIILPKSEAARPRTIEVK